MSGLQLPCSVCIVEDKDFMGRNMYVYKRNERMREEIGRRKEKQCHCFSIQEKENQTYFEILTGCSTRQFDITLFYCFISAMIRCMRWVCQLVCSRARARLVRDHICLGGKDWALGSVVKGIGVSGIRIALKHLPLLLY